jgi:hypothetical protein
MINYISDKTRILGEGAQKFKTIANQNLGAALLICTHGAVTIAGKRTPHPHYTFPSTILIVFALEMFLKSLIIASKKISELPKDCKHHNLRKLFDTLDDDLKLKIKHNPKIETLVQKLKSERINHMKNVYKSSQAEILSIENASDYFDYLMDKSADLFIKIRYLEIENLYLSQAFLAELCDTVDVILRDDYKVQITNFIC